MKATILKLILLGFFILFIQCQMNCQVKDSIHQKAKINVNKYLNMVSFGYQIGGLTYFGAEYEYRFSEYIGYNIGIGIKGYNTGFKFHSCPCRNSPFLNISFKDANIGKMGTINVEIGGVMIFFDKKQKMGLISEIGFGKILYLSNDYKQKSTNHFQKNDIILAFDAGICIYINK